MALVIDFTLGRADSGILVNDLACPGRGVPRISGFPKQISGTPASGHAIIVPKSAGGRRFN